MEGHNNGIMRQLDELLAGRDSDAVVDRAAILAAYERSAADHASTSLKIFSVIGGVLAAIAFVGFLLIGGLYQSQYALLICGLIFIMAGIWLNRVQDSLTFDTFGISIFFIGYWMVSASLSGLLGGTTTVAVCVCLMAFLSILFSSGYMIQFTSVLFIGGSLLFILIKESWYDGIHVYNLAMAALLVYVTLNEPRFLAAGGRWARLFLPLRIGLVCTFLMGLALVCKRGLVSLDQERIWLSSMATIGAVLYVVYRILPQFGIRDAYSVLTVMAATLLVLLPTVFAPAIAGGLLIILLAYRVDHRTAFVMGILALIYFIGQYYYDLEMTLLKKSILMMCSGVLFILFYLFTHKKMMAHEKL